MFLQGENSKFIKILRRESRIIKDHLG